MKRGFTVVEILITLAVMAVLLGLGVVSMRSVLVNGRDSERKADIDVIARGLESYYRNGNPMIITSTGYTTKGTYPGLNEFYMMAGLTDGCSDTWISSYYNPCKGGKFGNVLPGVSDAAVSAPDVPTGTRSLYIKGESGAATNAEVNTKLAQGYYIYAPSRADGATTRCVGMDSGSESGVCGSFVLMYQEEATGSIVQIKSRHN